MTEVDLTGMIPGKQVRDEVHKFVAPPPGQGSDPVCSRCGVRLSVANQHIAAGSAVMCDGGRPDVPGPVLDARERRQARKEERARQRKGNDYNPTEEI